MVAVGYRMASAKLLICSLLFVACTASAHNVLFAISPLEYPNQTVFAMEKLANEIISRQHTVLVSILESFTHLCCFVIPRTYQSEVPQ